MKEPERIPLTDSIKNKEPKKIKLEPLNKEQILDHENYLENNSQSIQELESDEIN